MCTSSTACMHQSCTAAALPSSCHSPWQQARPPGNHQLSVNPFHMWHGSTAAQPLASTGGAPEAASPGRNRLQPCSGALPAQPWAPPVALLAAHTRIPRWSCPAKTPTRMHRKTPAAAAQQGKQQQEQETLRSVWQRQARRRWQASGLASWRQFSKQAAAAAAAAA
jgi:hypothetical protein